MAFCPSLPGGSLMALKINKVNALKQKPEHYENQLFFDARNLAIEALLLRIEVHFLRLGFSTVKANWSESSFGPPVLEIRFYNPKPGKAGQSWEYATCKLYLTRTKIQTIAQASECFYGLDKVVAHEYWGAKESKQLLAFRAEVVRLDETKHWAKEIHKTNFPFDHTSFSSF